jgi:hypothetical protein
LFATNFIVFGLGVISTYTVTGTDVMMFVCLFLQR